MPLVNILMVFLGFICVFQGFDLCSLTDITSFDKGAYFCIHIVHVIIPHGENVFCAPWSEGKGELWYYMHKMMDFNILV